MASIFQTPKTKRDPRTGKKIPVLDASGNTVMLPKWRTIIITHRGIRKTFTFTKNRAQSQKQADLLEAREKEIRLGLRPVPSMSEAAARRAVDDIFGEYLAWGRYPRRQGRPPVVAAKLQKTPLLSGMVEGQAQTQDALRSL